MTLIAVLPADPASVNVCAPTMPRLTLFCILIPFVFTAFDPLNAQVCAACSETFTFWLTVVEPTLKVVVPAPAVMPLAPSESVRLAPPPCNVVLPVLTSESPSAA
jgi:hypothetical protein